MYVIKDANDSVRLCCFRCLFPKDHCGFMMMWLELFLIFFGLRMSFQFLNKQGALETLQISMQVLQWMEDTGIQPSNGMIRDIVSFAQTSGGAEYATIIQERIGKLMFVSCKRVTFVLVLFLLLI